MDGDEYSAAALIARVRAVLEGELGVRVRVCESGDSVADDAGHPRHPALGNADVREAALRYGDSTSATIVTSPALLRAYDSFHPERIACIVIKRGSYWVVVRDREAGELELRLRYWWRRDSLDELMRSPECIVCLRSVFSPPEEGGCAATTGGRGALLCPGCHAVMCVPCRDRTTEEGRHCCPACRRWILDGPSFGTPWDVLRGRGGGGAAGWGAAGGWGDPRCAVDRLVTDVLARLDGRVRVLLRVDGGFLVREAFAFVRVGFSPRTLPPMPKLGGRIARLRTLVERALERSPAHVMLYVARDTFRMGPDGPVTEASAFYARRAQAGGGGALLQLGCDAWLNMLSAGGSIAKVEYLPAARELTLPPPHVRGVLEQAARALRALARTDPRVAEAAEAAEVHATLSVARRSRGRGRGRGRGREGDAERVMTLDVSVVLGSEEAEGGPGPALAALTMHADAMGAWLAASAVDAELSGREYVVLVRALVPRAERGVGQEDEGEKEQAVAGWRFDGCSSTRMDPEACVAALEENADGLGRGGPHRFFTC